MGEVIPFPKRKRKPPPSSGVVFLYVMAAALFPALLLWRSPWEDDQ